jgi:hypothetical protein
VEVVVSQLYLVEDNALVVGSESFPVIDNFYLVVPDVCIYSRILDNDAHLISVHSNYTGTIFHQLNNV